MVNFSIKKCDVSEIVLETIRFISHLFLLHVMTVYLDKREEFMNINTIKMFLYIVFAVLIYHLILKKIFKPIIKKMKNLCQKDNKDNNISHKPERWENPPECS